MEWRELTYQTYFSNQILRGNRVRDYWLISLSSSICLIIEKVLENRLWEAIDNLLVHSGQHSFCGGVWWTMQKW